MPLFNKGAHVERAIASVLAQTGGFDELIVVDDGSIDDGPGKAAAFGDPRIRLLHRSPPGPGGYAARNLAIREAQTDWIAFLDADDAWEEGFTTAVEELISRHGEAIGGAFTSYNMRDPTGRLRQQKFGAERLEAGPGVLSFRDFLKTWITDRDCPIWTGASAFRRDLLLQAELFPAGRCRRGGDKDLWLRLLALRPAAYDPRPYATYFRDADNMVTSTVRITAEHCIVPTVHALLAASDEATAALLRRLSNTETLSYALSALRSGSLSPEIYATFYDKGSDHRYYLLQALRAAPSGLRPLLAKAVQRTLS
jgi:succinoglycan biosynthesis protein ExoO